jgi:hypothetical protein
MITEIKEIDKIKVGYWILSIYDNKNLQQMMKITHINGDIFSCSSNGDKHNIINLFESISITDYVSKTKKEMENYFPEYFI